MRRVAQFFAAEHAQTGGGFGLLRAERGQAQHTGQGEGRQADLAQDAAPAHGGQGIRRREQESGEPLPHAGAAQKRSGFLLEHTVGEFHHRDLAARRGRVRQQGFKAGFDAFQGLLVVSSRNSRVLHATAISVSVRSDRSGLDLRIDDGQRELAVGFSGGRQEGLQFAQRRITEAAALVHVASAYGLYYRRCLPGGQASGSDIRRAGA